MTSTETSNFHNNLNEILCELNEHHRDKSTLKLFYLNERLNKSLSTYYHEITKTFEYLSYRNDDNLIKKYERIMK